MSSATLKILSENDSYLAIDKPSGINSAKIKNGGLAIADLLSTRDRDSVNYGDKPEDAGLVNRLDFETSGILIAAKSREAWLRGRQVLLSEGIYKSYIAYVEGKVVDCIIENFIGTPNRGAKKVKIFKNKPSKRNRALPAKSEIRLLTYDVGGDFSIVKVVIHAARRHQVRAHLAFIGHPLLGDLLYGSTRKLNDIFKSESREFLLHAEEVRFLDPATGELFSAYSQFSMT